MVLEDASPLRRLPEAMLPKQAMLFNGVRFCGEVVLKCMPELRSILMQLTTQGEVGSAAAPAMTLAWSVVDAANRMRALLQAIDEAGWAEHSDEFADDLAVLAGARRVRNALQHLEERIATHSTGDEFPPVWGALSWFAITDFGGNGMPRGGKSCVLIPGSVMKAIGIGLPNPMGRELQFDVDEVGIEMFGEAVSVSELERAVERLVAQLERSLSEQIDPGLPTRAADLMVVVSVEAAEHMDSQPT